MDAGKPSLLVHSKLGVAFLMTDVVYYSLFG